MFDTASILQGLSLVGEMRYHIKTTNKGGKSKSLLNEYSLQAENMPCALDNNLHANFGFLMNPGGPRRATRGKSTEGKEN